MGVEIIGQDSDADNSFLNLALLCDKKV